MGSISFVSIMVILVRRHFFQKRFEYLVENNAAVRDRLNDVGAEEVRVSLSSLEALYCGSHCFIL